MFGIRLRHDHILVRLEPKVTRTSGGILLPDTTAHPVRYGRILQTGPGKQYLDTYRGMDVKESERVVFLIGSVDTKGGKAIAHHLPEEHVIVREPDILFVIPDDSTLEVTL